MLVELKKLLNECKDCIITAVVALASILTDGQKKTVRNILVNISFFAAGYAVSDYAGLSDVARMVVSFTTGRYAAMLDVQLEKGVSMIPEIVKRYLKR